VTSVKYWWISSWIYSQVTCAGSLLCYPPRVDALKDENYVSHWSERVNFQSHSFKISVSHPLPSIIYFPFYAEQSHGSHTQSNVRKILFFSLILL